MIISYPFRYSIQRRAAVAVSCTRRWRDSKERSTDEATREDFCFNLPTRRLLKSFMSYRMERTVIAVRRAANTKPIFACILARRRFVTTASREKVVVVETIRRQLYKFCTK
ncbi:uncharacterized protein LOC120359593 [Solenopsis invicta]|uniref:uncharacterized protein LOC120359593 n=1 Tax=Solenopsis invicta TaxID=13686 RepID=UPI00193D3401|nr:uncharacterized protein LOC120359593 [Solenopsis invicta]